MALPSPEEIDAACKRLGAAIKDKPRGEGFTLDELSAWMNLPPETILEMVDAGLFPPPMRDD